MLYYFISHMYNLLLFIFVYLLYYRRVILSSHTLIAINLYSQKIGIQSILKKPTPTLTTRLRLEPDDDAATRVTRDAATIFTTRRRDPAAATNSRGEVTHTRDARSPSYHDPKCSTDSTTRMRDLVDLSNTSDDCARLKSFFTHLLDSVSEL